MARLSDLAQELYNPSISSPPSSQQTQFAPLTNEVIGLTEEGRPIIRNEDGTMSSERTITITHPMINNGKPTNIPTIYNKKEVNQDEAINIIINSKGIDPETGRRLNSYDTLDEAVTAAKARSEQLGIKLEKENTPQIHRISDLVGELTIPSQTEADRAKLAAEMMHKAKNERLITRAEKELPELGRGGILEGENKLNIAKVAPLILLTSDPREIGDILTNNFKNVRITEDEGGNIIANNIKNNRQVVINKPGITRLDVLQGLGLIAAYSPAGTAATGATTTAGKIALGATAAAGTETAIQGLQALGGGEFNVPPIALAGGFGAAAETITPIRQTLSNRAYVRNLNAEVGAQQDIAANIQRAKTATKGLQQVTGKEVGLFRGQQTLTPSDLVIQRVLPQLSAGSRYATKELAKQNHDVYELTNRVLATIATDQAVETGTTKFRTATQLLVKAKQDLRQQKANFLFKEATRTHAAQMGKGTATPVDLTSVMMDIGNRLNTVKSDSIVAKVLRNIAKKIDIPPTDRFQLQKLQNAKFEIDAMLTETDPIGKSLPKVIKRDITLIQQKLVDAMESASPMYRMANKQFQKDSPAIAQFYDSILGRISRFDDIQLDSITGTVFSPRNSISTINNMKNVIKEADPNVWDNIVGVELQKRFGSMRSIAEQSPDIIQMSNLPSIIKRAIFGNPKQRDILFAALDGQPKQNFLWLETILNRASQGRAAGSPTTPFKEALDKMRGSWMAIRDFIFKPIHTTLKTTGEVGEKRLFDRRVAALTKAFYDPKWEPRWQEIRKIKDTPTEIKAMFQFLNDVEQDITQEENQ